VPKVPPAVSAYFSALVGERYKKLGKKGRSVTARNAATKGWAKLSKRQRALEMKRRARVRQKNKVASLREDELLRERIQKRKAGLDE
jgi:hypothetical protein